MKPDQIMQIFHDTAYVRMGGTQEELRTAEYLRQRVAALGLEAGLEAFPVDMADLEEKLEKGTAASVFVENPSYLGFWEEQIRQIAQLTHAHGALLVVQPDVASLGVVEPPAHYGADIVCGDI